MNGKLKRSSMEQHHVLLVVLVIGLIWLCICYARRGVYYLDYEFLYMRGKDKFVGKNTELQMEKKKDAFYFTIKDKESKELEKAVLRWSKDVSEVNKEYEITFGENYVITGKWTQDLERDFYYTSGCFGGTERHEDVAGNQCRALCRIAAGQYEHQGDVWNGILGVCVVLIGAWCCIPYNDVIFVQWGLPKIQLRNYMRFLEVLLGVGLVLCGISMTCRDWVAVTTDRIWYEIEKSTHC